MFAILAAVLFVIAFLIRATSAATIAVSAPLAILLFGLALLAARGETGARSPVGTCRRERGEGIHVGLHGSCNRELTNTRLATADRADRRRGTRADPFGRKAAW
jgi:hypothetical protein